MNSEELARVKTSGRQGRGNGDDERGVKPARDGNVRAIFRAVSGCGSFRP